MNKHNKKKSKNKRAKKTIANQSSKVWVISWDESEAGWGQRSDGYSIHSSEEARDAFKRKHEDCSTSECILLAVCCSEVVVSSEIYNKVKSKGGTWFVDRLPW